MNLLDKIEATVATNAGTQRRMFIVPPELEAGAKAIVERHGAKKVFVVVPSPNLPDNSVYVFTDQGLGLWPCWSCEYKGCQECARFRVDVHDEVPGSAYRVRYFHDRSEAEQLVEHFALINSTRATYGIRAEMTDRKQATKET